MEVAPHQYAAHDLDLHVHLMMLVEVLAFVHYLHGHDLFKRNHDISLSII
jgi:hypothetical protein